MVEQHAGDLLYESPRSVVRREHGPGGAVVVKSPNSTPVHELEMRHYRRAEAVARLAPDITPRTTLEMRRGIPHLVMIEFAGRTLANRIEADAISLDQALLLGVNLANLLGRFHDLGLVHRELESSNIWLDDDGRPYLLDLESVEGLPEEPTSGYRTNRVLSPEQLSAAGGPHDPRSDLYAFGLILLTLLGCGDLFPDDVGAFTTRLRSEVDPVELETRGLPAVVGRIVSRLLTPQIADRYQSAGAVATDLRRCLNALSVAGEIADFEIADDRIAPALDLEGHLVDRDEELAVLAQMVDQSATRAGSVAIVEGSPGSGKSSLLRSFAGDVSATGAVFAYGKLEQGQSEPYAALGQALSQLVLDMLGARPAEFEAWQGELEATVRPIAGALVSLVPDLRLVLPDIEDVPVVDDGDARSRLHRAMAALLQATSLIRPVVLVIDDLQWADSDTELALSEFASSLTRNYAFIGAHRSGEYSSSSIAVEEATTRIVLNGLSQQGVRSLLVNALGDNAALDDVSQVIFERTAGNPLFVKQLVRQAQQEGVLRFEAVSGRWIWDRQGLNRLKASENVVALLVASIEYLTEAHADVISAVACIGGTFSLSDACAASDREEADVAEALWAALELRLIESESLGMPGSMRVLNSRSRYRFSHDRIAEAAVSRLSGESRQQAHLRYGRTLLEGEAPSLFAVAHHLNEGLMLVSDADERLRIAELNLEAAQLARRQAAFLLALDFYESGISLLGAGGWSSLGELVAALHLGAAETSYLVGDMQRAHEWLDTAGLHFAGDSPEAARAAVIRMKALVAEHRLQEAFDTALSALDHLDEALPRKASQVTAAMAIVKTRLKLRSWTDDQIRDLPICQDPRVLDVDRILGELSTLVYFVQPELFPVLVFKGVSLTLEHGKLSISPVAIANHGSLIVIAFKRYRESQRWAELALDLCGPGPFQSLRPWVEFLNYNFISHWQHPIHDAIEPLRDAHRTALLAGDMNYAGWAGVAAIYRSFNLGLPLSEVDGIAEQLIPTFHSQTMQTRLGQSTQQLCLNLMGRADEPFLLAGESGFDEREVLEIAEAEGDLVAISATAISKMGLHFWFRDFAGALAQAEIVETHLDGQRGTSNVPTYHLINAISRLMTDPRSKQTRRAVKAATKLYKEWGDACEANYGATRELLNGIRFRVAGKHNEAEKSLDRAVSLADEHRFAQYAAMAREELGGLYVETGRTSLAKGIIRDAYEQWRSIGYVPRYEHLLNEYPWLENAQQTASMGSLDVNSVLAISQALSSEINLDQLLRRLVDSACDLTGATKAMLFTPDVSRPRCRVFRDTNGTRLIAPGDEEIEAPYTVVRYVERTARPLRLEDVSTSAHSSDSYIRQSAPHSTLTIPISIRASVVAVLHLESAGIGSQFSIEHQQLLMMLSGQIGASLQNAQLVDQLEDALDSQTALTTAQSRFIPDEFLELFGRDNISSVTVGDTVQRRMSVLISDIRGYTRLVEQLSLPEAGRLAIDFLQSVEPSIIGNNGFVHDMRGDEVLALFSFGAADAVRAGLAMQRSQKLNNDLRRDSGGPDVAAGIGITTGEIMFSMVGGVNHMTCGVIGDAVNLAARIEGLNKRYGSGVLIDGQTHAELPAGMFATRRMERVRVVNRQEPVTVYEVYDDDTAELFDKKQRAQPAFDEAFALFDAGELELAAAAFERCQALVPGDPVAEWHYDYCTSPRWRRPHRSTSHRVVREVVACAKAGVCR